MKVYELMSILAGCESGADVKCSATITTPELESNDTCGEDDSGDPLYSICKDLDDAESCGETVYLNF